MVSELFLVISIFALCAFLAYEDLRSAFVFLLLVSVLLHKEVFSLVRWDVLPIRVVMLSVLVVCAFKLLVWLKRKPNFSEALSFFKDPFLIFLTLLWLVRLVSLVNTKNMPASLLIFAFFSTVVFLYYLMAYLAKRYGEKFVLSNIKFYSLIAVATAFIAVIQFLVDKYTGFAFGAIWRIPGNLSRVGSVFWDVNHYGGFLASMIPVVFGLFVMAKTKVTRVFYGLSTLFMLGILLLTSSRSAWIGFAVALCFISVSIFILKFGAKRFLPIILLGVLFLFGFYKVYVTPGTVVREKVNAYLQYRGDSFASHIYLLEGAYEIFTAFPYIGGGFGSYYEHFKDTPIAATYYARDPAALSGRVPAHSIWGELLSETGFFGTFAFVLLVLSFFATLYYAYALEETKTGKVFYICLAAPMLSYLVSGIFYSYNGEFFWLVLFFSFIYAKTKLGQNFSIESIVKFCLSKHLLFVFALSVFSFLLLFVNLGANSLIPWDEAIYAKVAKNMVQNQNYLTLTWDSSKPWLEKPPIYMWVTSFFMKLFGFNSFAVKLGSALAGLMLVIGVYFVGSMYFSKLKGFLASVMLLTSVHFIYYSRVGMLDVMLSLFMFGAFSSYLAILNNRKKLLYWLAFGTLFGLALMTKGASSLAVIPAFVLSELTLKQKIEVRGYLAAIGAFSLVALPWHIYQYTVFGSQFLETYVGYHVFKRATESIEGKGQPFFWYLTVLRVSLRLWFIPIVFSLVAVLSVLLVKARWVKNRYLAEVSDGYSINVFALAVWFVAYFLFYSSSISKLIWYIIPIYPIALLLASDFVVRLIYYTTSWFRTEYVRTVRLFSVITLCGIGFFYLFFVRDLAFAQNYTGEVSRLITLKDTKLGVNKTLYYDRIEKPLPLFYTDGTIKAVDYNPLVKIIGDASFDEDVIYITKNHRFEKLKLLFPNTELIESGGELSLARVKSESELVKEQINSLSSEVNWIEGYSLKGNPIALSKQSKLPELKASLSCFNAYFEARSKNEPSVVCEYPLMPKK